VERLATLLELPATHNAVQCFAGLTSAGLLTDAELADKEQKLLHPKPPKKGQIALQLTPEELQEEVKKLREDQVKPRELHSNLALLRQVAIPGLGECLWDRGSGMHAC
jgi:hypothetical protein